jgi:NADH dehydrogenase FAD-containing subunit
MNHKPTQILILGAGYAGLMAALRLSGKTKDLNVQLTLVDASPVFIQRPRLHHVAVDQHVPEMAIKDLIRGTRIHFLEGWVAGIDPFAHQVEVQIDGEARTLGYDYLVYGLGSQVDRSSVPGVRQHAYALDPSGPKGASDLRAVLKSHQGLSKQLVVVGGGATGIEVAAEVKGVYPNLDVSLITADEFGSFKGPRLERHFRQAFQQQGIEVIENKTVRGVHQQSIELTDGVSFPADITIWAGGFRALDIAREAGFKVNHLDQTIVDPFGRSLSHPDVYGVGDSSHPLEEPGNPVRMSLFTALVRGAHAADNLAAHLKGKPQNPLSFAYYGQGIAMGPKDAVGFLGFPSDKPVGPILRGKLAVHVRNFFVWLIFYFLVIERRFPGTFFWLGKNRYSKSLAHERMQESFETEI